MPDLRVVFVADGEVTRATTDPAAASTERVDDEQEES